MARRSGLALLLVELLARMAHALNNGLARTPPCGFNTWSAYGPAGASAAVLEQIADLFVSTGLAAAGYEFVNMDDGAFGTTHARTHARACAGSLLN